MGISFCSDKGTCSLVSILGILFCNSLPHPVSTNKFFPLCSIIKYVLSQFVEIASQVPKNVIFMWGMVRSKSKHMYGNYSIQKLPIEYVFAVPLMITRSSRYLQKSFPVRSEI